MKYVLWLLKAAIFFTLFAFALNNQQVVSVHFFFGTLWQAPLGAGGAGGLFSRYGTGRSGDDAALVEKSTCAVQAACSTPAANDLPHGI